MRKANGRSFSNSCAIHSPANLPQENHSKKTSGDQDTKIPLTQTRIIANQLGQQLKLFALTPYAPWYNKKQIGGWAQLFGGPREGKNVTYITFATVRGAAHEVPFTSPSQALTLFRALLGVNPLRIRPGDL